MKFADGKRRTTAAAVILAREIAIGEIAQSCSRLCGAMVDL
jgi:hypothetical protein